jgi:hypothetical protein
VNSRDDPVEDPAGRVCGGPVAAARPVDVRDALLLVDRLPYAVGVIAFVSRVSLRVPQQVHVRVLDVLVALLLLLGHPRIAVGLLQVALDVLLDGAIDVRLVPHVVTRLLLDRVHRLAARPRRRQLFGIALAHGAVLSCIYVFSAKNERTNE